MSCNITKNDLIDSIIAKTEFDKKTILPIVDSFLEEIKNSLENGDKIELRGFGTFEPRLRKGRLNARNPKTGEKLSDPVAPHYIAAFRAGKDLHQKLWNLTIIDEKSEKK